MLKLHVLSLMLLLAATSGYAESAEDLGPLFLRLDADGDGHLVEKEIPAEHAGLFDRLLRTGDGDRDGRLSPAEFSRGLTPTRPAKPLAKKAADEVPGSEALLLMLAWMDSNADLVITAHEVPARLKPLFDEFLNVVNTQDRSRIRVPQLRQQSIRFAALSTRFARQLDIDVEVEMSLLNDDEWAYVKHLKSPIRPGSEMGGSERASFLFAELDTNGDGKVAADEVPEQLTSRLARLIASGDRDLDKQLSEGEFKAISQLLAEMQSNRPSPKEVMRRVNQLLRRFDRNRDGRLGREELPRRIAGRLEQLDDNGDNQLDVDELTRGTENLPILRNTAGVRPNAFLPQ